MSELVIRPAKTEDIPEIERIIGTARQFMRDHGNTVQWSGTGDASIEAKIPGDIERGVGYVVTAGDKLCGYFAFIIGADPTYSYIEGEWPDDEEYGTLHRVASDGTQHGVTKAAVKFAESKISNRRMDTYPDNATMKKIIAGNGFTYAGIIYVEDGTPRVAYWKKIKH